jgi:hypothetical protein
MNKCLTWSWSFVLLLSFGSGADETTDSLARIIEKNTGARGGAKAISSVHTIHTRVQITEPTFQVIGEYVATRDGQMRIDILADGTRVFTEAYDGEQGWQMSADGSVSKMSEAGENAVRHGIVFNLFGLFEMPGIGLDLKYAGPASVDGRGYEKIDLTFEDGLINHFYLDNETGHVVRERDEVALHPDVDVTVQRFETIHGDFRSVGGVVYAWHAEKKDMDTGGVVQTIVVQEIVQNPDIDPVIFSRPD